MSDVAGTPTREMMLAHADFVRGLARRLLRDEGDAEDLAQDVLVAAIDAPPRHGANVRGWLAGVARNLARMRARSASRRRRREWAVAAREGVGADADFVARLEVQRDVVSAVLALDEPYRSTVFLRFYEGQSPPAIARRQDVPVKTVHTRLRRALAMLRARLDAAHGGRRAWMAILGGGLIVSGKAKAAVAAAVVLALIGGGWMLSPREDAAPTAPEETVAAVPPVLPDETAAVPASTAEAPPADAPAAAWDLYVLVLGPDGKPCASSVDVAFLPDDGGDAVRTYTNSRGRACLAASGAGSLAVRPHDLGPAPKLVSDLTPPAGGRREVRVRLEEGLAIEGILLDAHGEKVPGARVVARLLDPPGRVGPCARRSVPVERVADSRTNVGRFRIEGLAPGRYVLEPFVGSSGRGPAGLLPHPLPEADAGDLGVRIQLAPAGTVVVVPVDAENREPLPVPADLVKVTEEGERTLWMSGPNRMPKRIPLGETWRLRVRAYGYADSAVREVRLDSPDAETTVEFPLEKDPGAVSRLTVLVRDESGQPVEGSILTTRRGRRGTFLGVGKRMTREAGGRFVLELMPGTLSFRVRPPRGESDLMRSDEIVVEVARGEEIEREVVLRRGGSLRLIHPPGYRSGILLETLDGEHVSGTGIRMLPAGGRIFTGVPPGPIVVKARHPDGRWVGRTLEVRAGETTEVVLDVPADPPEEKSEIEEMWEEGR